MSVRYSCTTKVREPTSAKPGRPARRDAEYKRRGTANVFAIVAPRLGFHLTHATKNRKSPSYVRALQRITKAFPKAKRIHLVQDNLSSHSEAACIRTLGPTEGRKLWARFIVHFTPKHGSWLVIAPVRPPPTTWPRLDRCGSPRDVRESRGYSAYAPLGSCESRSREKGPRAP
ncbi:MAG: transposase [Myxococcaceae bacterium]